MFRASVSGSEGQSTHPSRLQGPPVDGALPVPLRDGQALRVWGDTVGSYLLGILPGAADGDVLPPVLRQRACSNPRKLHAAEEAASRRFHYVTRAAHYGLH